MQSCVVPVYYNVSPHVSVTTTVVAATGAATEAGHPPPTTAEGGVDTNAPGPAPTLLVSISISNYQSYYSTLISEVSETKLVQNHRITLSVT
jgi:hypothetical protein